MHRKRSLLSVIDTFSDWTGKAISFLMIFIIAIMVWEVILRYIFNAPTHWAHEMTQFLFAFYCILGSGYTLSRPLVAHVRMDVFYKQFSARKKAVLNLFSSIFFFLFIGVLIWIGWEKAWESLVNMERSTTFWRPPLFPLRMCIPVGAFLLIVQGAANFIRDLHNFITLKEKT